MHKRKTTDLAIALQGFFHDYLPTVKGMSIHTIRSYRDSLLAFTSRATTLATIFKLLQSAQRKRRNVNRGRSGSGSGSGSA